MAEDWLKKAEPELLAEWMKILHQSQVFQPMGIGIQTSGLLNNFLLLVP